MLSLQFPVIASLCFNISVTYKAILGYGVSCCPAFKVYTVILMFLLMMLEDYDTFDTAKTLLFWSIARPLSCKLILQSGFAAATVADT